MDNGHQPATKADVEAVRSDVGAVRSDLEAVRSDVEAVRSDLEAVREQIRDTETKLLTAFYDFAKTNQQRVSQLETTDANLTRRISVLEDRLLEVEKRLNMPPAA